MSADDAQRAILYLVELLMNNNGSLSTSQLAGHFGDRIFTREMRSAAGGNEAGLKKLLLKYPSLFSIHGNRVSLYGSLEDSSDVKTDGSDGVPDVTAEMGAVQYFRSKLMPKGNRWVEIKSLAGHLSQASPEIRALVGPQVEFGKWLARHMHIFEVRDTSVRLQKDVLADSFMVRDDSDTDSVCSSRSFSGDFLRTDSDFDRSRRIEGPRMAKQEQKLVWLIKDLVKAKGSIDLNTITSQLAAHAPIELLGIGERIDPLRTIRKYPGIFKISENNMVSICNVTASSTRKKSLSTSRKDDRVAIMACCGPIFHLSKLWGIIDLGNHEHVFFDQSIIEKSVSDLRTEYQIGEVLFFDAVRAPKSSRAKWKAVRIWKELDDDDVSTIDETEMVPSVAGLTLNLCEEDPFLQPVDSTAEQTMLNNNWRNADFLLSPVAGENDEYDMRSFAERKQFVDAECQTISTGDIIATQFYFSE